MPSVVSEKANLYLVQPPNHTHTNTHTYICQGAVRMRSSGMSAHHAGV